MVKSREPKAPRSRMAEAVRATRARAQKKALEARAVRIAARKKVKIPDPRTRRLAGVNRNVRAAASDLAHIGFCLDMSGSMDSCRDATISGFNEWLQGVQRQADAADVRITLIPFNSNTRTPLCVAVPAREVLPLNQNVYRPNDGTPLYDSIAALIRDMEARIGPIHTKSPLIFIMTDGEENSSREWSRERILELIRQKTAAGWTFGYLGANQDAWAVGASIGVARGNTMHYQSTPQGMKSAMGSVACATRGSSAGGYAQSFSLFAGDRGDDGSIPQPPGSYRNPDPGFVAGDPTLGAGAGNFSLNPVTGLPPDYLKISDVAKRLQVSSTTVRREIDRGKLSASRVGNGIRISAVEVENYLTGRPKD